MKNVSENVSPITVRTLCFLLIVHPGKKKKDKPIGSHHHLAPVLLQGQENWPD